MASPNTRSVIPECGFLVTGPKYGRRVTHASASFDFDRGSLGKPLKKGRHSNLSGGKFHQKFSPSPAYLSANSTLSSTGWFALASTATAVNFPCAFEAFQLSANTALSFALISLF